MAIINYRFASLFKETRSEVVIQNHIHHQIISHVLSFPCSLGNPLLNYLRSMSLLKQGSIL